MDLALDRLTHDLVIENYDLKLQTGGELMRQRLKQSLLFFRGEWYLDVTDGVPYYQDILKKSPDRITVESVLKAAILETPGILELRSFLLEYDNPTRALRLTFTVDTIAGGVTASEVIA